MNWRSLLGPLILPTLSCGVQAVILFGTGDPAAHTTPPTGGLTASGWDSQIGPFGAGTVVGPAQVLTAAHVGFRAGSTLVWGGLTYTVLETADRAGTDLRLLRVGGRFSTWASHYKGTNEVGATVVLHGRGGARGEAVYVEGTHEPQLHGWLWNPIDGRLRWGTNVISDISVLTSDLSGEFLSALFTGHSGDGEATVSVGDSGGGVFLQGTDGTWKLAGVISAVQSTFKYSPPDDPFNAALFNRQGFLEELEPEIWAPDPTAASQPATAWYATRVSTYADWLEIELGKNPANPGPRLLSAPVAGGPFREHPAYATDAGKHRIQVAFDAATMFFQLEGETTLRVIGSSGGTIILAYGETVFNPLGI